MQVKFASFHSWGIVPSFKDLLNKIVTGKAMDSAVSFKKRGWNSSGPVDFETFNNLSMYSTFCLVTVMSQTELLTSDLNSGI